MLMPLNTLPTTSLRPFKYRVNDLFKTMLEDNLDSVSTPHKEEIINEDIFAQTQEALNNFNTQNALVKTQRYYA